MGEREDRLRAWAASILLKNKDCNRDRLKALLHSGEAIRHPVPSVRQQEDWDCGLALLEAACKYFKKPFNREAILKKLEDAENGMHPDVLEGLARDLGIRAQGATQTWESLQEHLEHGPVACVVQADGDGSSSDAGHWVLVTGLSAGSVYAVDPRRGKMRIGRKLWERRWHDIAADGIAYERWGVALSI